MTDALFTVAIAVAVLGLFVGRSQVTRSSSSRDEAGLNNACEVKPSRGVRGRQSVPLPRI